MTIRTTKGGMPIAQGVVTHEDYVQAVATSFWTEDPATAEAVTAALPTLETALRARDLRVASLSAGVGPADTPDPTTPRSLLDVRA